jgi:hypothetical protein
MSLRCVGAQNVRTAPNAVLNGATTASVSLWVQLNAGSKAPASGAVLLGKSNGDPVSLVIVGGTTSILRARWYANNGGTETGSYCDIALASGVPTHLAMTFAPGVQQYFVNGVLVQTDACASPLGRPADNNAPESFQVGPDVVGLDVTLDEPTIWQGYALTQTDVTNLVNRVVHPNGVAPAQVAWGLSLAGNGGVPAATGDAGLADITPSGRSVTAVSTPAPSYAGGVLSYTPPVHLNSVKVGPSNQSIICAFSAADGSTPSLQSLNPTIMKTVGVTGASGTFTLTVNGQTTAPIPIGADVGTVQAAIAALSGIGSGNIQVQGIAPYLISGAGSLAGQPLAISVNASGVSPSFAAVPGPDTAPGSGNPATIYNTDPACTFSGSWTRINNNSSGASATRFISAPPGPLSPCLATFTFGGVAAGTYDVFAAWPTDPSNATAAPYRVCDGTTLRAMTLVNQQVAPVYPVYGSFTRSWLARVYCASGTIRVVLSNDADASVVADTVAISPVSGLSSQVVVDDTPDVTIPNGLCTFTGTNWSVDSNIADYNLSCHQNGSGSASEAATWELDWLAPGTYDVEAYWPSWYSGFTSNATYTVYDGTTRVGAAAVDQRAAPAGGQAATGARGVSYTFQSLGTFTINSGSLRVVLTARGDGGVNADAILVRPTGATPLIGRPPSQTISVTASVQSFGGQPTISINSGSPITLTLPIVAGNCAFYPLTAPVPAGAAVTFSAPASWAQTSAGGAPAVASAPVTTGLTTLLPPFDSSTPKTMEVGYNVPRGPNLILCYADLMKQGTIWNGGQTVDSNGWLLATAAGGNFTLLTSPGNNNIDGSGMPSAPFGPYTIMWDTPNGQGNCWLSSGGGDVLYEDPSGQANLSATTDRTRVFVLQGNRTNVAPSITAWATGNCTNIRVWPPGVPTDGSQLFHPEYLRMLAGAKSLRTSGMIEVNSGNVVDYADFPTPSRRMFVDEENIQFFAVQSITPTLTAAQQAAASRWWAPNRHPFVVTTSSPHNFKTGHIVYFRGAPNSMVAALADGEAWDLSGAAFTALVLDATTFACAIANTVAINSVSYSGGVLAYRTQFGCPPEHAVALANAVGNTTLHFNVPQQVSDACCTQLFQMIAANLDRSCKLRVELSNEPWNTAPPYFTQFDYFTSVGVSRGGLDSTQAYVQRASEVHALAVAAFVAAGRPASDVIRMFNTIRLYSAVQEILTYAAAHSIPVDELAGSLYFNNGPGNYGPEYDFLTLDQVMDTAELNIPGYAGWSYSQFRQWVDSCGFQSTKVTSYEWGPASMFMGGSNPVKIARSQGGDFHPRMYGLVLHLLQETQDGGCAVIAKAGLVSPFANDVYPSGAGIYGAYAAWNMPAGIGDGSDGSYDNRPVLAAIVPGSKGPNFGAMASPVGAAINRWNALMASGPQPKVSGRAPQTRNEGQGSSPVKAKVSHPNMGRRSR